MPAFRCLGCPGLRGASRENSLGQLLCWVVFSIVCCETIWRETHEETTPAHSAIEHPVEQNICIWLSAAQMAGRGLHILGVQAKPGSLSTGLKVSHLPRKLIACVGAVLVAARLGEIAVFFSHRS